MRAREQIRSIVAFLWLAPLLSTAPVLARFIDKTNDVTAQTVDGWRSNGPGRKIRSLAIAPGDPSTIYAGSGSGAFKSSDGGASWISAGLTQSAVSLLVIDPSDPNTVYTVADGAVFKSTDGGTDWSPCNKGLPDPRQAFFSDLAISPGDASTIYLAAGARLFKSIDRGQSWSFISYVPG